MEGVPACFTTSHFIGRFLRRDVCPVSSHFRYLIGEAMYGGRVTDDFDRRVLNTYLKEYVGDFIFDKNQTYYFSQSGADYTIPIADSVEHFLMQID